MSFINFDVEKFKNDRKKVITIDALSKETGIPAPSLNYFEKKKKKYDEAECKLICDACGFDLADYTLPTVPVFIAFATNKGGAGKTTDVVNVAAALATHYGKKVLVVDTDLQQNTTMHLGMLLPNSDEPEELERIKQVNELAKTKNIFNAFAEDESDDIQNHILNTSIPNLDIVVSVDAMSTMDTRITTISLRELRMRMICENLKKFNPHGYDFVIFDCNPSLNQFNQSVLCACDYLIIPMEANPFGLRGCQYVINFYLQLKKLNNDLDLLGIILNKYTPRKNITKDVVEALQGMTVSLGEDIIFDSKIPVDTNIENAQAYGEPVITAFPKTKATKAFVELAKEILDKIEAKGE